MINEKFRKAHEKQRAARKAQRKAEGARYVVARLASAAAERQKAGLDASPILRRIVELDHILNLNMVKSENVKR